MMFISSHDDDEKNNELGVAEYYTAILSPPCMMRMYRHMLITQTALLNATAAYEDERRRGGDTRPTRRAPSLFQQRLVWDLFCDRHGTRSDFTTHMRMSKASFYELLSLIRHDLEVDETRARSRGGAILPELCLYCCLRYCAGGLHSDIRYFIGISKSSFYRVVWKCIDAINKCPALSIDFPTTTDEVIQAAKGFTSISSQGCIWNCVAVLDGYHLQIRAPSKAEVKNVKSFFSGHYQTHGINIQAACDHNCRFVFLGVAGPGVMGDRDALNQIRLGSLIESLPGLYCTIGDCAYTPSEHLVPIFRGENARTARNDNFNFFASQLRIRIEMAFGLMVRKWGLLSRPLEIKVCNIKRLMVAIGRLHNFCIDKRLAMLQTNQQEQRQRQRPQRTFTPTNTDFDCHEAFMREAAAEVEYDDMVLAFENPWSYNRDRMAKEIESLHLTRPRGRR
jgi:DDE superfamily endonuclease